MLYDSDQCCTYPHCYFSSLFFLLRSPCHRWLFCFVFVFLFFCFSFLFGVEAGSLLVQLFYSVQAKKSIQIVFYVTQGKQVIDVCSA